MHKRELVKPDGRRLFLYGRRPLEATGEAPSPVREPLPADNHLRWHPLRREWVAYAAHRQHRTFLPPAAANPLAPTADPQRPTEVPAGNWDVAVFENLFPAFTRRTEHAPPEIVPTRPGRGACEVVVFTQDAAASLSTLALDHVELLVDVWADRTADLGGREDVGYVMPFENRGEEMGVTLSHPHGQIYAYPFLPPVAELESQAEIEFWAAEKRTLFEAHVEAELTDGRRILYSSPEAVAFVPACARWAYEVWVAPRRATPSFPALGPEQRRELARALLVVVRKYDALWNRPFPYVLVWHQAPTDGLPHPEAHLHAEIYPAYRMRGRLKYLAGSELGAGVFTADTLPEDTAHELQAIEVAVE